LAPDTVMLTAQQPKESFAKEAMERLIQFNTIFDSRFEDITSRTWIKTTYRDLSAGLIVALTAIPMAMGFSMAMGLRPEQGIIAGALACLVGRTWGGSKYQVYGPTAAFIPVIAGLMMKYGHAATGGNFMLAHGMLVFTSIVAGIILMIMGLAGAGKLVKKVPNSIVVGFTIGISVVIATSNIGEVFGLQHSIRGEFFEKLRLIGEYFSEFNAYAFGLAMLTFVMIKGLLKKSVFIPAPLLAIVLCTILAETVFADKGIVDVAAKFGSIPANFFVLTPPALPPLTPQVVWDLCYFSFAIVFVSSIESLLCSSMADRLANNKKTPFNPDKELWGQGLVQIVVPLVNGFPCTGALARTATSIKAGAVSPLAGYFKGILKIALAIFLAPYLEMVPLACIGGILLWVSSNMVKVNEIKEVWKQGRLEAFLMVYTAIMVPVTDFLTGVLSALAIYVASRFFAKKESQTGTQIGTPPLACESHLADEPQLLLQRFREAGAQRPLAQVLNERPTNCVQTHQRD
jgi:sulfate permease, SulP family